MTENERVSFAIVSVDGFLGVGDKLIAVPFDAIQLGKDSDCASLLNEVQEPSNVRTPK